MSLQQVEMELDVSENAVRGHALWNASQTEKTHRQAGIHTLNARLVEFIAKPGNAELLEECVRTQIMNFLNRQKGFAGAIILNSHQERRLILVVSFWTTQRIAEENCWERSRVVRQAAGALIDVCSRVHTYGAAFATSSGEKHEISTVWASLQEVQE
jgi:heme-degrading monooxygenase HmoA